MKKKLFQVNFLPITNYLWKATLNYDLNYFLLLIFLFVQKPPIKNILFLNEEENYSINYESDDDDNYDIITLKNDVIVTLTMVTVWENDGCNCDYFGIRWWW